MRGLLVRIGADQSKAGGGFNGSVNGTTNEFTYVPIPEDKESKTGMEKPYALVRPVLSRFGVSLPRLRQRNMHLDPDFEHLTYGDEGRKGSRIKKIWEERDGPVFLVFYAGLRDVNPNKERLLYAIVGFYMIEEVVQATEVSPSRCDENAHTCCARLGNDEIVVRAKRGQSGRLKQCLPIGCYRPRSENPNGCPQYRVKCNLLKEWGGLSVKDGWLQRGMSELKDADRFLRWFRQCSPDLISRNN